MGGGALYDYTGCHCGPHHSAMQRARHYPQRVEQSFRRAAGYNQEHPQRREPKSGDGDDQKAL